MERNQRPAPTGWTTMTMLYQCDMSSGTTRTRAYIPVKGAKVGSIVKFKDSDDDTREWRVESVSDTGIDERYLSELVSAYRNQRKASDI